MTPTPSTDLPVSYLTKRQLAVLEGIALGTPIKAIARELGISPKTAETHRAQLCRKLRLEGTAELVRYAIRQGLISP